MATFATALTNRYLISYGASSVAAMGIALKISMVTNMIVAGLAFGAQPLIGYTYGAQNKERFNKVVRFDIKVIAGFAILATILLMIFAPVVIRWFMKDPVVIKEGTIMIRWLSSSATFGGIILVFTTMFQSMGKAVPAFWLSFSRQGLIFAIVMVLLQSWFGYTGIIAAQPVADVLTFALSLMLYQKYQPKFE